MRHGTSKNFARAASAALRHIQLGERPALLESVGKVAVTFRPTRERAPMPAVCPVPWLRMQVLQCVSRSGVPSLLFTSHRLSVNPALMSIRSEPLRTYDLMLPPGSETLGPALDPERQAIAALDGALCAYALFDQRPTCVDFLPELWAAYPITDPPVLERTPMLEALAAAPEFDSGTTVESLWELGRMYFRRLPDRSWTESSADDAEAHPEGAYIAYPLDFVSRAVSGSDRFAAHPWLVDGDGRAVPRPGPGEYRDGWIEVDGEPTPLAQRGEILARFTHAQSSATIGGCVMRNPSWWALSAIGMVPALGGIRYWMNMSRTWPNRLEVELRRRQGQLVAAVRAAYEAVGLGPFDTRRAVEAMRDPAARIELPGRTAVHVLDLGFEAESNIVHGHGCALHLREVAPTSPSAPDASAYSRSSAVPVEIGR